MGLGDQQDGFFNWYENSGQENIDQGVLNVWQGKIDRGEKLGPDFIQEFQNKANAAAERIKAFNAYKEVQRQRQEQEDERQRLMQELNPSLAIANEEIRRNEETAARNAAQVQQQPQEQEDEPPRLSQELNPSLADANEERRWNAEAAAQNAVQPQPQAEVQQTNGELQRLVQKMSPTANEYVRPEPGRAYRNQEVKLAIGSTDYGSVSAQVYEYTGGSGSLAMPEKSELDYIVEAFQSSKTDGGKIDISTSTVSSLKDAGSVALDTSGEFAFDRGGKGETITLPSGKMVSSETLKTYGETTKGIGVLLDAKDVKEYGEQVFQEAKNRGMSDEDADNIAHRAAYNYSGWFKIPERGGQALLAAPSVPYGGYIGIGAGVMLEWKFQDDIKDYFMNRAITEYMIDKENWQNFKAPDPSIYYNRTR